MEDNLITEESLGVNPAPVSANTPAESDHIHYRPQTRGCLFGIELEIEAGALYSPEERYLEESDEYITIDPIVPKGWAREQEDSIDGVELISNQPYDYQTSVDNIIRVFDDIKRQGYEPIRTPRGSTHIHVNVADLTWQQMKSFVMACIWAEGALIELAGKGRKGNLFAQSYETTPIGWSSIIQWCRQNKIKQTVDTHYMATSFYPMSYLGSVEFRMGPSSRTAEEALQWLYYINEVAVAGRETTVTDKTEPPFLEKLLSFVNPTKRDRIRRKSALQAKEVYQAMQEPWVEPVKTPKLPYPAGSDVQIMNELLSVASPTLPTISASDLWPSFPSLSLSSLQNLYYAPPLNPQETGELAPSQAQAYQIYTDNTMYDINPNTPSTSTYYDDNLLPTTSYPGS